MNTIYINTSITQETERMFSAVLEDMIDSGVREIDVLINTQGGSILAGAGIFGAIRHAISRGVFVNTINIGNALSMGAGLLQAGSRRKSYSFARAMVHGVQVPENMEIGDAEMNMINSFRGQLKSMLQSRSKLTEQEVDDILSADSDVYFSSEELLAKGLIDEVIYDGYQVAAETPERTLFTGTASTIMATGTTSTTGTITAELPLLSVDNLYNQITTKQNDMQSILQALGVSTEAQALEAINSLKGYKTELETLTNEVNTLQAELDAKAEVVANSVVDKAIAQGKISEDKREDAITAATKDADAFVAMLDVVVTAPAIAATKVSATELAGSAEEKKVNDSRKDWTYRDWETKDPSGLLAISKENEELYNELLTTIGQ